MISYKKSIKRDGFLTSVKPRSSCGEKAGLIEVDFVQDNVVIVVDRWKSIPCCTTVRSYYSAEVSRYCVVTTCNGIKLAQVKVFVVVQCYSEIVSTLTYTYAVHSTFNYLYIKLFFSEELKFYHENIFDLQHIEIYPCSG